MLMLKEVSEFDLTREDIFFSGFCFLSLCLTLCRLIVFRIK